MDRRAESISHEMLVFQSFSCALHHQLSVPLLISLFPYSPPLEWSGNYALISALFGENVSCLSYAGLYCVQRSVHCKDRWEILFSSFKHFRKTGSLIRNPLRFLSNQTVFGTFASWMEIKPRVECTVQISLMLTCDPCNRLRDAVKHIDKDLCALVSSVVFVAVCVFPAPEGKIIGLCIWAAHLGWCAQSFPLSVFPLCAGKVGGSGGDVVMECAEWGGGRML